MNPIVPSLRLIHDIENSEIDYMSDRMIAIQNRPNNPEGIEIQHFGNAVCFYSRTMPWPTFNTVKGLTSADIEYIEPIVDFYRSRDRKVQFEIIPSLVDQNFLRQLADVGLYQSGFHCSLYTKPRLPIVEVPDGVVIREVQEEQFDMYATIHCRGTGLSDDGIPYVAQNNKVLYHRLGWKFFIAYVNEVPAAASVMYMKNHLASLTFAATLPEYRNLGLHSRMLRTRLVEANRNDCRLAIGQCAFLSQSHRNMERIGMNLGYVRTSWTEA
ncbi:GNAT family N-acetyltransferase [Paenibacillus sp. SC116]|uniref:GNAT family N-acetyltransferase n=1 Tax=Paenibacillus sp. SC116 TaxID=2968986 RepID=UPI00215B7279|nr:GNAT family N-acetyltransferase [Paenibacillus sp. SC116]MCR8843298.1 GNAT family N-acetyltransferase [Paenibacillus sp. SC116]